MNGMKLTISIIVFLSMFSPASAATWYVDAAMPSSGDGKSWGAALKTIQGGIDAASDGDTVIVAQETYVENIRFNGKNITLTTTDPLDPSVVANTIIDGNQSGSVVTFSGTEMECCVLSGFTIRNGTGEGGGISGSSWFGSTRARIENSAITGNSGGSNGGGLYGSAGTIRNCNVSGNSATGNGGGCIRATGPSATAP
jgi:hypothetical protein